MQNTNKSDEYEGKVFKSNYWGDFTVIKYTNNKDIDIQFHDSGYVYNIRLANIIKGEVKDQQHSTNIITKRSQAKTSLHKMLGLLRKMTSDIKKHKSELKLRLIREKSEEKKKLKDEEFMAKTYNHFYFGNYKAISVDGIYCTIQFERSGSVRTVRKSACVQGCLDLTRTSEEDWINIGKERAKETYSKNREDYITKASKYQKDNLERTRERNRNRRVRLANAEGSHTKEDLAMLLGKQNHKCANCNDCIKSDKKELDHILPLSLGGSNYISNLQWLCQYCSRSKSDLHPDNWAEIVKTAAWKSRKIRAQKK